MTQANKTLHTRSDYKYFTAQPTRWADNDIYGHVNNVAYYSFFDTAVNGYLISHCGLDIHNGAVIGLVVETGCSYHAPLAYPDIVEVGLRVSRIGNSSVVYEIAIFKQGEDMAAANGRFVHVYVDRETRRPVALPAPLRSGLELIMPTLFHKGCSNGAINI